MELVKTSSSKRAATWTGLWTAGCFFCAAAGLDSAPPTITHPAAKDAVTIPLEYRELSFSPIGFGLTVTLQPGAFKREPQFGKSGIRRGRLHLPNSDSDSLPFLWDCTRGKLYLDLNRNEDLTDDPTGIFSTPDSSSPARDDFRFGSFRSVPLMLPIEAGRIPCLVDLNFSEYRNRLSVYASVRSFWAGKALLAGREWQVGWVPGAQRRPGLPESDYLLLRAWSERENNFSTSDGSLDAFAFPRKLFLPTATYEVACDHTREGDKVKHQITFREQPLELGEVSIPGQFVQRLLLTDGPCVAVLDSPQGTVRVPAGRYDNHRVQLGKGESLACLQQSPTQALVVSAGHPATLLVGGPLTNNATLSRRAHYLVLEYQLLGAGGGIYALAARDYQHPPQFTVYQGDRQIGSGKFEFG